MIEIKKILDPIRKRLEKLEALQDAQQRASESVERDLFDQVAEHDDRIKALETERKP
jgi:hypothetical protein